MIYFKRLTYEERAVWGTCPVCEAKEGEECKTSAGIDLLEAGVTLGPATHTARLFNAPIDAAVNSKESTATGG